METGSSSPCLDLSRINVDLAKCFINSNVDLVILEGMGRAIHSNYNTKFKCDCLKIAVIKNEWLAKRFQFNKNTDDQNKNQQQQQQQPNKFPFVFTYECCN